MIDFYENDIKELSGKQIDKVKLYENINRINLRLPKKRKEKEKILKSLSLSLIQAIEKNDWFISFGLTRFILMCDFVKALPQLKSLGVFRASKYNYKVKLLKELIINITAVKSFSEKDEIYFRSVLTLYLLAPDIASLKNKVKCFALSRPNFLKHSLALAEVMFTDESIYKIPKNVTFQDLLYKYSKESILSSISYSIFIYLECKHNVSERDSIYLDEKAERKTYENCFQNAFLIQQYNDSEIKVDFFDYNVQVDLNTKIVNIYNDSFELATRIGYVKSEFRRNSQIHNYISSENFANVQKFSDFLKGIWQEDGKHLEGILYEIKREPMERIILRANLVPYGHEVNIFSLDKFFLEELAMLKSLTDENYNGSVLLRKIYKEFTISDIIKLQRYFGFIGYLFEKISKQISRKNPKKGCLIQQRSILPVMKTEKLAEMFSSICGHSSEDCEKLIAKLSIDSSVNNKFIDLQYCPIIKMGKSSMILPSIFARSNLVRSLALIEGVHLSSYENQDHMVSLVSFAFKAKEFIVKTDLIFGNVEFDIIAFRDGELFIFECKNPYHPVNDYELRNTHSHILTGFSQVREFKKIFSEGLNFKHFLMKVGIQEKCNNVYYGIINANRALYGLNDGDTKVLHANELISFLQNGEITIGDSIYLCWSGKEFHVSDLTRFMSGQIITEDLSQCKNKRIYGYKLRNYIISFNTFEFEIDKMPLIAEKKYHRCVENISQ